jgi:WS/DGAT/MGAT family acyltransferase
MMLAAMLDRDPSWRPTPHELPELPGERLPTDSELLRMTALEYLRRPEKLLRANARMMRDLRDAAPSGGTRALLDIAAQPLPGPLGDVLRRRLRTGYDSEIDRPPPLPPTPAPRTPWNRAITPHRRFAFTTVSLEEAKRIRRAFGCTFNDVVMALCAGTLRKYLLKHSCLPDEPLIAGVPVSIRAGDEDDVYQNRVSFLLSTLATDQPDPLKRLRTISRAMTSAKEMASAMPAQALQDYTRFAPPAIAARAMRLASQLRILDRMNPPFNLIISNVPGPSEPLYSAGARLEHFYPVSAIADGQGLNMTVQSYNGNLDFGFISCRELVPDLWAMVDLLQESMQELVDGAEPPKPKRSRKKRG